MYDACSPLLRRIITYTPILRISPLLLVQSRPKAFQLTVIPTVLISVWFECLFLRVEFSHL